MQFLETHNVHLHVPAASRVLRLVFQPFYSRLVTFQFPCISVILVASWNWAKLRDTSRLDVVRAVAHCFFVWQ